MAHFHRVGCRLRQNTSSCGRRAVTQSSRLSHRVFQCVRNVTVNRRVLQEGIDVFGNTSHTCAFSMQTSMCDVAKIYTYINNVEQRMQSNLFGRPSLATKSPIALTPSRFGRLRLRTTVAVVRRFRFTPRREQISKTARLPTCARQATATDACRLGANAPFA